MNSETPKHNEVTSVTRRNMVRYASLFSIAGAMNAFGQVAGPVAAAGATSAVPAAPVLTPWVQPCPITQEMVPAGVGVPPGFDASNHIAAAKYPAKRWYDLPLQAVDLKLHPQLKTSSTFFSYGGSVPGKLWRFKYGEPVVVRLTNQIDPAIGGFGTSSFSPHFHNMHTPSYSDGYPGNTIPPAANPGDPFPYRDHHYPMILAGGDSREALGSLWYHDHQLDYTAQNVYRGMMGMAQVFDAIDSGNENDTNPAALRLPSGKYDISLLFHDPRIDPNTHEYIMDVFNMDGHLGNTYAVNGAIQPYMQVEQRKYRFRLHVPGPTRIYTLALYNPKTKATIPWTQLSFDGNLLTAPRSAANLEISPAQRCDVVIDFSKYPTGTQLYVVNQMVHTDPRSPSGLTTAATAPQLLRFDVGGLPATPDNSRVPATLRALPPLPSAATLAALPRRTFKFDRTNGSWTVNGSVADLSVVSAAPIMGRPEIWRLEGGGNWWHPVHIHFEEGRILKVNDATPSAKYAGRRDMYLLEPGMTMEVLIQWRDFKGQYVMHCHNSVHEDHSMMVRFDVS